MVSVITSQCSRHTVDPTGLNGQEFNLVRKGGFFIGDGWYSGREGRPRTARATYSTYVLEFLRDTRAPFLVRHLPIASQVLCDFILQKPDDTAIPIATTIWSIAPTHLLSPFNRKPLQYLGGRFEECLEINILKIIENSMAITHYSSFLSTQGCFMRSDMDSLPSGTT